MKFLVCISSVPDTTTKITFTEDGKSLNSAGVQFIINPYDELSLTRAIELKEALGGSVTVISVGDISIEPNIRKALAIGADDAVRINARPNDGFFVASQIASYAKEKGFGLIFTGRESIDYNGGQICGMLGEILQMPSINLATKVDVNGNTATIEHDIDGGKEIVEVLTPLVLSAQKDLCEPRIPNMRGIMTARTKPLEVIEAVSISTNTEVSKHIMPTPKSGCTFIEASHPEQLIDLLHTVSKVI